jgi:hypothetical protein
MLPSQATAATLDRVVAVVESELVMDSEVRLEDELARLDRSELPFWGADRLTALDRLVQGATLRVAAEQVALYQPTDEQVQARHEAVRATFSNRQTWTTFLKRHGLSETTLGEALRRRMVVERFLGRNLQATPDQPVVWQIACDKLVEQLQQSIRVRTIDEEPGTVGAGLSL